MESIFLTGSTGSIGVNVLNVIRELKDDFKVSCLSTNRSIDLLMKQIEEFSPEAVIVNNKDEAFKLKYHIGNKCQILVGADGLAYAAKEFDYDIYVGAVVGFAGLKPVIEAIKKKRKIAIANKETLVVAGEIVTKLCQENNVKLLPIDSEHSAVYQCLEGESPESIEKIILTASGGPFLNKTREDLFNVSLDEALCHPNWKMGNKITIDSATMMNKGLEVIEAHWLFNVPVDKIEVVIHPQSIIHSMVQFHDGSIKAQMGLPDMKLPIQYSLTYPKRYQSNFERTNFAKLCSLTFFEPDFTKFECLKLAYDALQTGGTAPCILNAANEVAVDKFLNGQIKFMDIPVLINKALNKIEIKKEPDLETIFDCDDITRRYIKSLN